MPELRWAEFWNIHEEAVVKLSERETAESSKHPFGIPDRQAARPLFRTGPIQDDGIVVPCSKPGSGHMIPLLNISLRQAATMHVSSSRHTSPVRSIACITRTR